MREGRSPAQIGKKGKSNPRWIVGGTLCFLLNQWGLLCAWECATVHVHDTHFHPLIGPCDGPRMVWAATGCHAKTGDPATRKVCPRGTWNTRMLEEPVLSMLTTVFQSKKVGHRVWADFRARLASLMAAFNILARWSMEVDEHNMVRLSIAALSL